MRKLKPKYKTLFISISVLLYTVIALSFTDNKALQQRCVQVQVQVLDSNENMFISAKDIDKILKKNEFSIIGYPVKEINSLVVEKAIEKHPSIENAHVYTSVKGSINVRVLQRKPLVRILSSNGDGYYIDDKGLLMPLSKNFTTRVPIVTGYVDRNYRDFKNQDLKQESADTLLRNLFLLSKELKNDKYWSAMCDQIYISKYQEINLIPKIGAKEIILNQNRNFAEELRILSTFYKEVLPVVGWEKYKSINLQFKQQIVCK